MSRCVPVYFDWTPVYFDWRAELLYRTVQWYEQASKMAAGPLFNIESSEDAIHQLHLPKHGEQTTPNKLTINT